MVRNIGFLKMYLEFVLIEFGKIIDMKTPALKEEFITYSSVEEGTHHTTRGCPGKHQGQLRSRRNKGESVGQSR